MSTAELIREELSEACEYILKVGVATRAATQPLTPVTTTPWMK